MMKREGETGMDKTGKLVIVGDGAFAEVAFVYFERWSPYTVAAFAVEAGYRKHDRLFDRPVVDFAGLAESHPPDDHAVYVAIVYTQLNRLRTRLARSARESGYRLASFVSPHAFLAPEVRLGEHCFIFENNVIQPFVAIGDNVVLWSGNHIGHHTVIRDNVFVSSHVVISGSCEIGENCFFGVNSTLGDNLTVGRDCWFGPGVVMARNVPAGTLLKPPAPEVAKVSAPRFFKIGQT
jgi:sugar O-acyltransferase (sialic acid O-acetyltransferase NeuD family)